MEDFATRWVDLIEPVLRDSYPINVITLNRYNGHFERVLGLVGGQPSSYQIVGALDQIMRHFHDEIVVPVQMHQLEMDEFPQLDAILSRATGIEIDFLEEAIGCAQNGFKRAAIVLGWAAAVNRFHLYVKDIGLDAFTQAVEAMNRASTGRYKNFKGNSNLVDFTDLQVAFGDRNLLRVLEYLNRIDYSQFERLDIALRMRNTSAHPGQAQVTDQDVRTFFSNIDAHVFSNPVFALETELDSE